MHIRTATILALLTAVTLTASISFAESLDELTGALDRAQEPSEYARLAERLSLLVSGMEPTDPERAGALVQLARARYLMGEAEPDEDRRLSYLDQAIEASENALNASTDEPRALYWRSMAYLQKADVVGGLSALRMVKHALRDFEKVETALPSYDGAGAYRSHGRVLMEAPAWAFIGDKEKGVELLEKARDIAPGTLINRLYLAEAYAETDRRKEAVAELEFIKAAPLSEIKPKDDMDVKRQAASLHRELAP